MPHWDMECDPCDEVEMDVHLSNFKMKNPPCPSCGGERERLIGMPVLRTDAQFGGDFFNKSADEWQDRSKYNAWKRAHEKEGRIVGEGPITQRKERHEKIGDLTSKYGPKHAKAQRLQYQQGTAKNKLDIVGD